MNFESITLIDKFFQIECTPQFLGKLRRHNKLLNSFLPLDEAVASRAVFVIVSEETVGGLLDGPSSTTHVPPPSQPGVEKSRFQIAENRLEVVKKCQLNEHLLGCIDWL